MAIQKWMSFLVLYIYSSLIFGYEAKIKLSSMEKKHSQEQSGDELYISITEYSKNHLPRNYQFPAFPSHWLSQHVSNIKDAVIWKKELKECEDIDLLINLVEEDVQPWNVDDSLGALKLKLSCQNGKTQGQWEIPDNKTVSKIPNQKDKFNFTGSNGQYELQFSFENIQIKT